MQQVTELMVQLQGTTIIAVTVLFAIGAMSTAFGFAILGSKFLECVARQPEMASMLQSKLYLLAAFIDAISMIAVGVGFFFIFANPFVAQLLEHVTPVITQ